MPTRHDYIHPAIRSTVDALCPTPLQTALSAVLRTAPLSPTEGPLTPETAPVDLDRVRTRLIQRLCAAEPNTGYTSAAQMGPLNSVELAAVLASDPEVLAGAGASEALNTTLINILSESAYTTIEQAALVGAAVLGVLHPHARKAVLYAVQEELTRDAENQRADEADERASAQTSVAVRRALV